MLCRLRRQTRIAAQAFRRRRSRRPLRPDRQERDAVDLHPLQSAADPRSWRRRADSEIRGLSDIKVKRAARNLDRLG